MSHKRFFTLSETPGPRLPEEAKRRQKPYIALGVQNFLKSGEIYDSVF